MRVLDKPEQSYERICIYGDPKTGKTRLATSLPWGPVWGEKGIYVPVDPNAEAMRSVLMEDREHLVPVIPESKPSWLEDFVAIATKDWPADVPGARTLIWDTMTYAGTRLLQQYADSGVFSDRHAVQLGRQGTKSWHTSPMQGDYGAAQNSIGFLLTHLQRLPMHVIVLFHAKWVEPKEGSPEGIAGGPDVVGSKAVRWVGGFFDTVLRTDVGLNPETKKPGYLVHTVSKGIWKAGFRTPRAKQSLAHTYSLSENGREFWNAYMKDVNGEKEK